MTNQPPPIQPAARLQGLRPYTPPPRTDPSLLLLDLNEGAAPPKSILDALANIDAESLRRYPSAAALEARIAKTHGIDPARVVVTAGGDDAIDRLCRATLEPGRSLLLHTPTFEMIDRNARLAGGTVQHIRWLEGPFPTTDFINRITPDTNLIALVTPNNPSGQAIPASDLARVIAAARAAHAAVLLDLAYIEFADEDPTDAVLKEPHVVMVRTFSKAFGLAGLRVGYAITPDTSPALNNAPFADWLRTINGPFPVSNIALTLAGLAYDDNDRLARTIETTRHERTALAEQLAAANIQTLPSQANYLCLPTPPPRFAEQLRAEGIAVRSFREPSPAAGCIRISLPGNANDFNRLTTALEKILPEQRP